MEMREEAHSRPSGWDWLQYGREPSAFERLNGATNYSPWERIHYHLDEILWSFAIPMTVKPDGTVIYA